VGFLALAAGDQGRVIYANVEALWSVSFLGKVKALGLLVYEVEILFLRHGWSEG